MWNSIQIKALLKPSVVCFVMITLSGLHFWKALISNQLENKRLSKYKKSTIQLCRIYNHVINIDFEINKYY